MPQKGSASGDMAKASMLAALYVVTVFLMGGVTHWVGLFLLPLTVYLGNASAIGLAAGVFLSSFIMPRDPLALLSATVGAAAVYIASRVFLILYERIGLGSSAIRMQIAGLFASLIMTVVDGTRTLVSWWAVGVSLSLLDVWMITFSFSFLAINLLGNSIAKATGQLLTDTERSTARQRDERC